MRSLIWLFLVAASWAQAIPTTPNLKLNLPPHNTPNWDIYVNQNFTMLDSYLGGVQALPSLTVNTSLIIKSLISAPCLGTDNNGLVISVSCGTGGGFTPAGDLSGTSTSQLVVGLQNRPVPPPTVGWLHFNGTSFVFDTPPVVVFTAGGDLSGSSTSQKVTGLQGVFLPIPSAGYLRFNGSNFVFDTPASGQSNLKHQRWSTCTLGPSETFCSGTATWTTAFPDTAYTLVCTPNFPSNVIGYAAIRTKHAGSIDYTIELDSQPGTNTSGELDCIAMHD